MSGTTRATITDTKDGWNNEPSFEELAEVPQMTRKEMIEIMSSEEYKSSTKVQKLIRASLAKGLLDDAGNQEPQTITGDQFAAKQAYVSKLFGDPRYKHDAEYRYEVQQKIAAMSAEDGHDLKAGDARTPNTTLSVQLSNQPGQAASIRKSGVTRVQMGLHDTVGEPGPKPTTPREPFQDVGSALKVGQ